jgi:hypothetical protein
MIWVLAFLAGILGLVLGLIFDSLGLALVTALLVLWLGFTE